MANYGMNRRVLLVALLFAILCTGIFAFFTNTPATTQISSVTNDSAGKLDSKVLGDIENNISTEATYFDLEYINGDLWATDGNNHHLYKVDPTTGNYITSYDLPFYPAGLASDGSFLYISVYPTSSGIDDGRIFKYTFDGIAVDNLSIEITPDYPEESEYLSGLACNGRDLYALSNSPDVYLYRINLDSWSLDKTIGFLSNSYGLAYYDGLLWRVDYGYIYGFDPDTGTVQEIVRISPSIGTYGLAYDGTHFLMSDRYAKRLYSLDIPTAAGEVWNQYATPESNPLDIAWNGTNYFLTDTHVNKVYKLDNLFRNSTQFTVPFEPLGIAVVGKYLYISQGDSPHNLYKYTTNGILVSTYAVNHSYNALEYDGAKLWGTDNIGTFIRQIDPSNGHIIASYNASVNYIGLIFDFKNNVFWAVDWVAFPDKICQLNPTTFKKTGVDYLCPTVMGSYGLEFNGKHLILTSWDTDSIYKIIIAFPSGGSSIPGFTDMVFLLSIMAVVSIWFLLRQARTYLRKM